MAARQVTPTTEARSALAPVVARGRPSRAAPGSSSPRGGDAWAAGEILQFVIAGLKNGAIYALVALGFTIVYAATQAINFAQGEFYMLGGMLGVFFFSALGLPLWLAALASVAATAVVGLVFEFLAVRPRADDPMAVIIITVGGSLLHPLARAPRVRRQRARPAGVHARARRVAILGRHRRAPGALAVGTHRRWRCSRSGCSTGSRGSAGRCVRPRSTPRPRASWASTPRSSSPPASCWPRRSARSPGVAVTPITQTSFDVGAAIGLKGFAAAILGGLGNPLGAVVGGLALGLIESLAILFLPVRVQGRGRAGRPARSSCSCVPRASWAARRGQKV